MPDELYSVLGVRKGATAGEIRDAYRKLAKKHHPDLNPGDTAAEDAFRKVQAAYDILSDKEKRKKYDLGEIDAEGRETPRHFYREYATAGGGEHPYHSSAGFDDLGHIFEDLFRAQGAGGPEGPEGVHIRMTGGDTHYRMEVGFLEAVKGAKKRITLPDGKALDVVIPPGHGDGQMLRLRGKGMPGLGGGEAGDAYVEVRVRPHKHFRRRGRDILLELPVAIDEAVLGAKVRVPTVTGTVTMTIPAGANGGDVLRLKGRGVPETGTGKHKQKAGDQLVTLTVVLPEKADAGLEEFLAEWAKDHKYDPRKGLGGDGR